MKFIMGVRTLLRSGRFFSFTALLIGEALSAGLLPPDEPYVEVDGILKGEAENYHARSEYLDGGTTVEWREVVYDANVEDPKPVANPRNGAYLQTLPNEGRSNAWNGGPHADYHLEISTAGTYQLYLRWSGFGGGADSLYAGFVDPAAAGGPATLVWYRDANHPFGDFDRFGWDELGQLEATGADVPLRVTFEKAGDYTLRLAMREDGAAIDAWRLELLDAYPVVHDDSYELRSGDQARLLVLGNDIGDLDESTLEIVSTPTEGTLEFLDGGALRYTHSGLSNSADSFSYRVWHPFSQRFVGPATVDLFVSDAVRMDVAYPQLPSTPPPTDYRLVEAFPDITFDSPHGFAFAPDGDRLFIAEADGMVRMIPDIRAVTPEKLAFLDIRDRVVNDGNEVAMKGVAVHPDYATNGYLYVTYLHGTDPDSAPFRSRLSRFTRDPTDPARADPDSELILLDLETEGYGHGIDLCKFGPEGYLYVGMGDEGSQYDIFENSQRIDKDLWSGILRIDVDKLPGNLEPNPSRLAGDIPLDPSTGLAHYSVPVDNPFVGAATFNGQPLDPAEVRTEFYAVGMRNPWQFDFMPDSTDLIVADVGRFQWEELSIMPKGGNGGWAWREGAQPGVRAGQSINGATEADADLVEPLVAYSHDVGSSITGGLVYQGEAYADLSGRYIYADYVSGAIWTLDPGHADPAPQYLTGEGAIVGFLQDPVSGEILLLDRGNVGGNPGIGRILRLRLGGAAAKTFPNTLSETNFFSDLATLTPNPGIMPYAPQPPVLVRPRRKNTVVRDSRKGDRRRLRPRCQLDLSRGHDLGEAFRTRP